MLWIFAPVIPHSPQNSRRRRKPSTVKKRFSEIWKPIGNFIVDAVGPNCWWLAVVLRACRLAWLMKRCGRPITAVLIALATVGAFGSVTYIAYEKAQWDSFEGTLLGTNGQPASDVEIVAIDETSDLQAAKWTVTDHTGHFQFSRLRRRSCRFVAYRITGATAEVSDFRRDLGKESSEVEIRGFPHTVGPTIESPAIPFETDWATMDDDGKRAAAKVIAGLTLNGEILLIEGHTDERGNDEYNFKLGRDRALTIAQMAKYGFGARDVIYISHGKTRPVARGGAARDHQANRRVIIRILPH